MAVSTATSTSQGTFPSQLSPTRVKDYVGIRPFPQFGSWGPTIAIAYSGATFRLVNWIAQKRREQTNYDTLWTQCQAANPDCFQQLQVVELCRPSWFLPRGKSSFKSSTIRP